MFLGGNQILERAQNRKLDKMTKYIVRCYVNTAAAAAVVVVVVVVVCVLSLLTLVHCLPLLLLPGHGWWAGDRSGWTRFETE